MQIHPDSLIQFQPEIDGNNKLADCWKKILLYFIWLIFDMGNTLF